MHILSQKIAAVVPVYNEVGNVEQLIAELQAVLSKHEAYEIIFVDDGSHDGTVDRLVQLSHTIPELKVVQHRKNTGQSASIVTGVRTATMDWIVTLDGDGQNDPADIPKLIARLTEASSHHQPCIIVGNREKRRDTWIRRYSSRIANAVRAKLLNDDCPDTGCSLKLFPRLAFLQLPHFNHCHRFLPALFKRAGFTVLNVPVSHRPRLRGQSKYGIHNRLWTGLIDLLGMIWLIRRPCQADIEESTPS